MKKFKGTPGPWSLKLEACDQTVALDIIGCGVCVSSAILWSSDTECDLDKAIANAHLIAAAPELLEALRQLRDYAEDVCGVFSGDCHSDHPLMLASSAITKALGE